MAKKKLTFADRAKQIMNKYKARLGDKFDKGDTLALEAMNQELEALRQEQEAARQEAGVANQQGMMDMQPEGMPLYAYGDFLAEPTGDNNRNYAQLDEILSMKEGIERGNELTTFLAGMQDYPAFVEGYNQYKGSPALEYRKDASGEIISPIRTAQPAVPSVGVPVPSNTGFMTTPVGGTTRGTIRNVGGTKRRPYRPSRSRFAEGGELPKKYALGGKFGSTTQPEPIVPNFNTVSEYQQFLKDRGFNPGAIDGKLGPNTQIAWNDFMQSVLPMQSRQGLGFQGFDTQPALPELQPKSLSIPETKPTLGSRLKGMFAPNAEGSPYKSRVPWLGAASQIVGNLLMNKQLDLPTYEYEEYTPSKATANLVNYGREREQVMRERDLANQMLMGAARGSGSQSSLMENIQAGVTGTQRAAGERFGTSLENEGNINAQILNQTSQFNAAQAMRAREMNERNRLLAQNMERENFMINADRKNARTQGIVGALTGYGKDRLKANQYDQMLEMMTPENYRMGVGKDSWLRNLFGISPDMKRFFVDTGDTISSGTEEESAYGGQLGRISLFGDDEYEKIMMRAQNFKNKKKD